MNVSVIDSLPRRRAVIDANRERIRPVLRVKLCAYLRHELPHGGEFLRLQIEDALYMAPWNHERMVRRNRVAVADGEGVLIFRHYLIGKQAAEWAYWLPNFCGIPVSFHCLLGNI